MCYILGKREKRVTKRESVLLFLAVAFLSLEAKKSSHALLLLYLLLLAFISLFVFALSQLQRQLRRFSYV